jgi:hypothetical protein
MAAGGAHVGAFPAAQLPQDVIKTIRDTVDGEMVPNLPWASVESLTCNWRTPKLGSGGFGAVFKGSCDNKAGPTIVCSCWLSWNCFPSVFEFSSV